MLPGRGGPEEVDWKLYVCQRSCQSAREQEELKHPQIRGSDWSELIPAGEAEAKGSGVGS